MEYIPDEACAAAVIEACDYFPLSGAKTHNIDSVAATWALVAVEKALYRLSGAHVLHKRSLYAKNHCSQHEKAMCSEKKSLKIVNTSHNASYPHRCLLHARKVCNNKACEHNNENAYNANGNIEHFQCRYDLRWRIV